MDLNKTIAFVTSTGIPRLDHMQRVADQFDTEVLQIVAWLHDVVEDTPTTLQDLTNMGYDDEVVQAVSLLTRVPPATYDEYINRLIASRNEIALLVKIADQTDNRTHKLGTNRFVRASLEKRYAKSWPKLQAALQTL